MAATPDLSRRAFLTGQAPAAAPLRPPWALAEADFLQRCTRCAACIEVCPEQVLQRDARNFPLFRPQQGECTFCGRCAEACVPKALDAARLQPWDYRARVGQACLARHGVVCQSCRDACETQAIRFAPAAVPAAPQLDLDRCSGCGACVAACPVQALALSAGAPP